ncbi:NAD(P)/FAD-dependent oxidoreductase [Paraburkholderia caballeronis]|uniref:NAD(P)/FAD-dependent oxidoreductase n=1 Tax=Paraburkholderia caballeronis TaxID=416943 RepID=UPI00106693EE|nr:FAD-dependent oxidoreductase [Paraburkholderia caballeronis]TDV13986.1 3-phenylpropionate/trans-cinnamate dioxygenase ferredoxin reductase subunit [Paraburkholderia caballeronis]TDV15499.1 3-phenylpropionate/trans-cinnamate dioxygenase ferredoxin reductase subunit [Paraburkholderia caballeronis]TDV24967.1 3-phenylpropionate/trans-cinnamate dioxygenase ferredoxin reductase subunit [Paraburkholderia caballeronis]
MENGAAGTVVIVGGGHAGGNAAALLRQYGYEGRIVLVGGEPVPPYHRPPLSKAYLKGEAALERLWLKPRAFYDDSRIELKLGVSAESIDRAGKTLGLSDGTTLAYDTLILATGSTPRALTIPGHDLDGVLMLRSLADADALRTRVQPGAKLAVIGAGYIGLEVAAAARQLGHQVTVFEAAPRVLARVAGEAVSAFYEREHRAQGVDLRTGATIDAFVGEGGRLTGVKLASGDLVPADFALVGIGVVPETALARQAGLPCADGVEVDDDARTADPSIFAIGDCAHRPLGHYGRAGRLESVHNAVEQAKLAASAIVGKPRPACDVPWFWSDQYDLKLQTVGLAHGHDTTIVRGDPAARRFAVYYLKDGALLAVDAVNAMPDFLCGKKLAGTGVKLDADALRDPATDLGQFAAAALAPG